MPLRFVPPGPEAGPIDWSLLASMMGEILTPFGRHVQLDSPHCAPADFPRFPQLPIELQIHVLRFCNSATLFQFMRTSAVLRHEAKKLFWSDADAWYLVGGSWLLAGGFEGETHFDKDFIRQVQQVEVCFQDMKDFIALDDSEDPSYGETNRIRQLWDTLQQRFPKVTRVVISEDKPRPVGSISLGKIQKVIESYPSGVEVYASFATLDKIGSNLATGNLTRFNPVNRDWELIETPWVRQIILIPPKVWRGPASELAEQLYYYDRYGQSMRGSYVLRIQAAERACFDGPSPSFVCRGRNPMCGVQFADGREWAVHAIETGHDLDTETPAIYKEEFARRRKKYEQPMTGFNELYKGLGSQERAEFMQAILDQLEHDPDYAQSRSVRESAIWGVYRQIVAGRWF